MNVAIDQGAGEFPNDTSLAFNGPRSEELSQNFPRDEEFEENEIMQAVVANNSDGYGDNDCNVIFDCNSGDDAKLTGDEGSGEENLQNSGETFPKGRSRCSWHYGFSRGYGRSECSYSSFAPHFIQSI